MEQYTLLDLKSILYKALVHLDCPLDDPKVDDFVNEIIKDYKQPSPAKAEQVGLRWVKGIDRVPEDSKEKFIRIEGTMSIGKWHKQHEMFMDFSGDFHPADQVEWLDSPTQPVKEPGQPAKEVNMDFAKWVTEAGYSYDKLNGWLDEKEGEYSDEEMWNLYQQSLTNKQPG